MRSDSLKLINGNLTVSGSITSNAGTIGGWTLGQTSYGGSLSRGGVYLGALGSGNGLVLDSGSGEQNYFYSSSVYGAFFRVGSSDSYIKFSAGSINNLEISSSGFGLTQGQVTASSGKIAEWDISGSQIYTGDLVDSGIEINAVKGIIGHGKSSTSEVETLGGEFHFGEAHHSIPPGEGGQGFNEQGGHELFGDDGPGGDGGFEGT